MIKNIVVILVSVIFYLLITQITYIFSSFYYGTNFILTALFAITIYSYLYEKQKVSLMSYLAFIFVFLFFRKTTDINYSFNFYLFDWIKLMRTDKIVFINIIGNLVLFLPLVFYLNNKYYLLHIILLILFLELLQLVTKRGVFDIVDIVLNIIGILIGTIIKWRIYGRQKQARN